MKILVIGAGYVGLSTAVFLSHKKNKVCVLDKNYQIVESLRNGKLHFKEELLQEKLRQTDITFCHDYDTARKVKPEMIIIAIDSATKHNSSYVMRKDIFSDIADWLENFRDITVILKSTNTVGFAEWFRIVLNRRGLEHINVVVSPEFLREGKAYQDTEKPERVIIGGRDKKEREVVSKLYKKIYKCPIVETSYREAELIKFASNLYLAHRLSFIYEVAKYTQKHGMDFDAVKKGISLDSRIGSHYLNPGLGFGGSCLPKDISLINYQNFTGIIEFQTALTAEKINRLCVEDIVSRIESHITLSKANIALLGIAFKGNVDDVRNSPAINLYTAISTKTALVEIYDPYVKGTGTTLANAVKKANIIIIGTDHRQFIGMSATRMRKLTKAKFVCDPFYILDRKSWIKKGFKFV